MELLHRHERAGAAAPADAQGCTQSRAAHPSGGRDRRLHGLGARCPRPAGRLVPPAALRASYGRPPRCPSTQPAPGSLLERGFIVHRVPRRGLLQPYHPDPQFELQQSAGEAGWGADPPDSVARRGRLGDGAPRSTSWGRSQARCPTQWTSDSFFANEQARRDTAGKLMAIAAALHRGPGVDRARRHSRGERSRIQSARSTTGTRSTGRATPRPSPCSIGASLGSFADEHPWCRAGAPYSTGDLRPPATTSCATEMSSPSWTGRRRASGIRSRTSRTLHCACFAAAPGSHRGSCHSPSSLPAYQEGGPGGRSRETASAFGASTKPSTQR